MAPVNIGDWCSAPRMTSCVARLVRVIAQNNCGMTRLPSGDRVQLSLSDICISRRLQSMVRPSRRGGVPVLRRATQRSSARSCWPRTVAAGSPARPPSVTESPQNICAPRNVPVAITTLGESMHVRSRKLTPAIRPSLTNSDSTWPFMISRSACAASAV